ncbi:hypothetical protein EDD85DRAFT_971306 [Armillaria nabsnona]|nr:hypothetical protein EDD85DRAFT_971306 [Armillaria nabsnona]
MPKAVEGTQVVGIEYVFDKQLYPNAEQTVHTVHASRLVVVSAGAMGTPLILEQSGNDLPGVDTDYDVRPTLPPFDEATRKVQVEAGSPAAAALAENDPVALDAPETAYDKEDDETIAANLGTYPMKPREQGGIVDKDINVYATTGLKITDLSISPPNNTYSATLAIGEKAAFIIACDPGINGV